MKLTKLKNLALRAGMYRQARTLHRHLFRRDQLQRFIQDQRFFQELLKPNSLCFDVGANVGEKSEALLSAGMRVVAFEPQSECMRETSHRCARFPNFTYRQVAMGSERGTAPLYISARGSATSSFHDNWEGGNAGQIQVPVITLNDAIAEFGVPDYCKLDVEGWELEVFKGLTHAIPLMSFEYHIADSSAVITCIEQLGTLGTLNFNITHGKAFMFVRERWFSLKEFLQFFPQELSHEFGDIFVRISTEA